MTDDHFDVLMHSLGFSKRTPLEMRTQSDKPYRAHFVADVGHHQYPTCLSLVKAGYMTHHQNGGSFLSNSATDTDPKGDSYFIVTKDGMSACVDEWKRRNPPPIRFTKPVRRGLSLVRRLVLDALDDDKPPASAQLAKLTKPERAQYDKAMDWLSQVEKK